MAMESLTGPDVDLERLWDVQATIHYTNDRDIRRTLRVFFDNAFDQDSLRDHTIAITGFPTECFAIDDDEFDENDNEYSNDNLYEPPILRHRKALYFEESKYLILTMRGSPHEAAGRRFSLQLGFKLGEMSCLNQLIQTGGSTRTLQGVAKEPDESWRPAASGHRSITFALESGVSESARALRNDAKIWLENPESHVTQVLTVKISRTAPDITFSVWKATPEGRETRAHYPRHICLDHHVRVTLTHGRPTATGTVCLSFEKLFERSPHPGTSEKDLVFSRRELGNIARDVWLEMGLMAQPRH